MFGEMRGKRACLVRGGERGHVWREEGEEGMFGERREKRACLARGGGRGHVWREEGEEGMFGERRGKRACLARGGEEGMFGLLSHLSFICTFSFLFKFTCPLNLFPIPWN